MKVFNVWVDKVDYDDYDSCIVVAESVEAVRAMMERDDSHPLYPHYNGWRIGEVYFRDWQGEIHIEEIDLNTPGVILSSFNAG